MSFTPRQREIWALAARGRVSKEIAAELGLSEFTIATVKRGLRRRLGVRNAPELTLAAIAHGVIAAPRKIQQGARRP